MDQEKLVIDNELIKKRNELDIALCEEDNIKQHNYQLESEIKNLRISEKELKNALSKKEEIYMKKIALIEDVKRKESNK
jgi:hypothetical protein